MKVCGITTEEDALLSVAFGADAVGFVFAPGSSRQITPAQARAITERLPRGEVLTFGVFRDEHPERVVEIVNTIGLNGAQLHGRESPSEVRYVRKRVPLVVQAFTAGDPAVDTAGEGPADALLLDGAHPGSGTTFDWSLAAPVPAGTRLILAGGLDADNVGAAIATVRPFGVDVSTGVERAPGRKDPVKLRRFVQAARHAGLEVASVSTPPLYDWARDGVVDG